MQMKCIKILPLNSDESFLPKCPLPAPNQYINAITAVTFFFRSDVPKLRLIHYSGLVNNYNSAYFKSIGLTFYSE